MGGRICSMVAAGADGQRMPAAVKALVAISYPLHPPGKPDRLRVEHLPDLRVPCLFVHGTKDPFGSPAELQRWTATIPGPVTHHWVEGRGHALQGRDAEVAAAVGAFLATVP
jgi:predicted alpha/beta-hydrolase family hydrolase